MITNKKHTIVTATFLFFSLLSFAQKRDSLPYWVLGGFVRPQNVNPIIAPRSETSFIEPMTNKQIHWESNDAFNPGATIKDSKIVILYRAEDKSGVGIGKRTSRLGYAESADGIIVVIP